MLSPPPGSAPHGEETLGGGHLWTHDLPSWQRDVTLSRDPRPTSHVYTGLLLRAQTQPLSEPHLLLLGLPWKRSERESAPPPQGG